MPFKLGHMATLWNSSLHDSEGKQGLSDFILRQEGWMKGTAPYAVSSSILLQNILDCSLMSGSFALQCNWHLILARELTALCGTNCEHKH